MNTVVLENSTDLRVFLRLGKLNVGVGTIFFQPYVSVSNGEIP